MTEPCGCDTRDAEHAEPHVDPFLGLAHGERDASQGDPPPYIGPRVTHDLYGNEVRDDPYCLCGHPHYLTCAAFLDGAGLDITVQVAR